MKDISSRLALASCALLSQHGVAVAQAVDNDWQVDSSILNYSESDDRVQVFKVVGSVTGNVSSKDSVSAQLVYDTMSGSTPTGLVANPGAVETVTGVSGGSFSTGADGTTLAEFDDTRLAANLDWTHQHNRTFAMTYGTALSVENDYQSLSASVNVTKETDSKLTAFNVGFASTFDTISRTGGQTPLPRSNLEDDDAVVFVDEATRNTYEILVGMSRVLNAYTIAQLNLTLGVSEGYHTDPYKLVSVADADGRPRGAVYESRPESRERHSIYTQVAHQFKGSGNIARISYRFYEDDWEVNSNTLEFAYHKKLSSGSFIEPHVRLYNQTAASFYTHFLDSTTADAEDIDSIPEFTSADYRLDEMESYTVGFKYGKPILSGGKLRFRASYVAQSFADTEFDSYDAVVLQLSFQNIFN